MRATVAAILLLLNGTIIVQLRILKRTNTKFHRLFFSPVIKITLCYFIHKHHVAVDYLNSFIVLEAPTSVLGQVALLAYVLLGFLKP